MNGCLVLMGDFTSLLPQVPWACRLRQQCQCELAEVSTMLTHSHTIAQKQWGCGGGGVES